ncbi:ABC transporter permease [Chryseolinea sp. T2]|uniref:ABC transporter permease n=1 Tax=Chryseolinea sp. T2 TaxID=3129255 RepID=UPI003077C7EC
MTSTFLNSTSAELIKTRNTPAFWLTIAGAALIPFINALKSLLRADYFRPRMAEDPWGTFIEYNWQIAAGFMLTMYVILLATLIIQIEFGNNAWKQVYATPRTYAEIYFSKFLILIALVLLCFLLFNVFIVAFGWFTSAIDPSYQFAKLPVPWYYMLTTSYKMIVSILGIVSIQFCLSLMFNNFAIPIGIGLVLFTSGFMIRQWELIYLYPYIHPFLVYFKNPGLPASTATNVIWASWAWTAIAVFGGYLTVALRRSR